MPRVLNAAVDCLFWPLYEVAEGRNILNHEPDRPIPVEEWLRLQKCFAHLLRPEARPVLDEIQEQAEADWKRPRREV